MHVCMNVITCFYHGVLDIHCIVVFVYVTGSAGMLSYL